MTQVFYVPGQPSIIDYARELAPGQWATRCGLLMLPELRVRYPGAVLGDEEAFLRDQEAAHGTRPVRISAARYDYALSHHNVTDFAADNECDSFKLPCGEVGNVTRIYAHWHGCYWTFMALATLPHPAIVERLAESATEA